MAEPPHADAGGPTNWRKEADERLRRLHSLLFGADAALERGDAAAAQALALRLLGFLDSQTLSADAGPDAAFVASIRTAASSRLATASRARFPDSDRYKSYPRAASRVRVRITRYDVFFGLIRCLGEKRGFGKNYCGYCSGCENIVAQLLGFTKRVSHAALGIYEI